MTKNKLIAESAMMNPTVSLDVIEARYIELVEKGYIAKPKATKTLVSKWPTPAQIARQYFSEWQDWSVHLRLVEVHWQDVGEELVKFDSYWTELNKTWTKQRWEKEKTFEVQKRLGTWLSRAKFNSKTISKGKSIW